MNLRHLPWKVPLKLRSLGELNKFCKDLSGNEIRVLCVCVLNSLIILVRTLVCVLSRVQLFLTPMDCSPPGSSVHGIFQAGILEWVAISFSRESSWPRDQTCIIYVTCWQMNYLPLAPNWDAHKSDQFSSVAQSCLFVTPWTAAHQASVFITNTQSLLKFMSIESVMPSNHLILCCPFLLPPSVFPSIRVFYN